MIQISRIELKRPIIDVIIPAYNEEKSIGHVIQDIPDGLVRHILVCNNNSTDSTRATALAAGAIVLDELRKGYGSACLKGIAFIDDQEIKPDIVVFLDGDYSDFPEQMPDLITPIVDEKYEMVIGSRALGQLERGSMQPQQIFGNWLATTLIKLIYNYKFTDLGPFRSITWDALKRMDMQDKDFGWTVEMQVKAAKMKMKCTEVPVDYKRRIGVSKVSGTVQGTLMAGHKILWTIFKLI